MSAELNALGARFRAGQHEIDRSAGSVQVTMARVDGAMSILAAAADGSSSDSLTAALSKLAQAQLDLEKIVLNLEKAKDLIDDHMRPLGL